MGVAQVFVGKFFVHRLQTTKSMKILPLKNYPLYGIKSISMCCLLKQKLVLMLVTKLKKKKKKKEPNLHFESRLLLYSTVM